MPRGLRAMASGVEIDLTFGLARLDQSARDRSVPSLYMGNGNAIHRADQRRKPNFVTQRTLVAPAVQLRDAADISIYTPGSDAGIPVYFVKVGTAAQMQGNIRQAITVVRVRATARA